MLAIATNSSAFRAIWRRQLRTMQLRAYNREFSRNFGGKNAAYLVPNDGNKLSRRLHSDSRGKHRKIARLQPRSGVRNVWLQ